MLRRFIIYFTGVIIGCFFVYFTLIDGRERDFSGYFPDSRVAKKISSTIDTTQLNYKCYLNCHNLNTSNFKLLLADGDVDFENSQTKAFPKKYLINSNFKGLNYMVKVTLTNDSLSELNFIHLLDLKKDCVCN